MSLELNTPTVRRLLGEVNDLIVRTAQQERIPLGRVMGDVAQLNAACSSLAHILFMLIGDRAPCADEPYVRENPA